MSFPKKASEIKVQYGFTKVPITTVFDIKMHWTKVRIDLQTTRLRNDISKRISAVGLRLQEVRKENDINRTSNIGDD